MTSPNINRRLNRPNSGLSGIARQSRRSFMLSVVLVVIITVVGYLVLANLGPWHSPNDSKPPIIEGVTALTVIIPVTGASGTPTQSKRPSEMETASASPSPQDTPAIPMPPATVAPLPLEIPNTTEEANLPTVFKSTKECELLPLQIGTQIADWTYVVDADDTLPQLSSRFLKDPERWMEIYIANQAIIGQQQINELVPKLRKPDLKIPFVQTPISYSVQPGDSLEGVMNNFYGFGADARWCSLHLINIDVIGSDPNMLMPNIVLKIYPLTNLASNQVLAVPQDTVSKYAVGYYADERKRTDICAFNGKKENLCDDLQPFEITNLPNLPLVTYYTVLKDDTWNSIAKLCYGSEDDDYILAAKFANEKIVGIDPQPDSLKPGQILSLWRCGQNL